MTTTVSQSRLDEEFSKILPASKILHVQSDMKEYASGSSVDIAGLTNTWRLLSGYEQYYYPSLVVFPESTEEVASIVALCNKLGAPVVPWGGGSNCHGSTLPIHGGVVVDLRKMNNIVEVDKKDLTVRAQAGISLLELQVGLNEQGFCHGTNPGSAPWATLGGSLCCEAHTLAGFEYGNTTDNVQALVSVLPDGKILQTRSRYYSGYNLNQLFTRSEGTLGIVTEITLGIYPMPEYSRNVGFVFDNYELALEAQNRVLEKKFDCIGTMIAFDRRRKLFQRLGLNDGIGLLLITIEGIKEIVQVYEDRIRAIMTAGGGQTLPGADADIVQNWWDLLIEENEGTAERHKTDRVGQHIWVPRKHAVWAYQTFKEIAQRNKLEFGVAASMPTRMNLGVNLDHGNPSEVLNYRKLVEEFSSKLRERGGTIIGAHGCGFAFNSELEAEMGENGYAVMKKIKNVLDPKGIMNPGKLFSDRNTV